MRTVGEILQKARINKGYTLESIEKKLKIRKKYLIALEENSWHKLPSLPYIKGFIKNYSNFLGLKPSEMVAILRRQFAQQEKTGLLPKGVTRPLNEPVISFTPQRIVAVTIITFFILLLSYLLFQYRISVSPPNLIITAPKEGEIFLSETIQVSGNTETDAVISVNKQKIAIERNGQFITNLNLSPGINTIEVQATSKFGKTKTVTRTIQIQAD